MRATVLSLLLLASLAVAKGYGGRIRCGAGLPACANNRCCSAEGFCGMGKDFCREGCQKEFGRCRKPRPSYPTPPQTPGSPPTVPAPPQTPGNPPTNQRPPRPQSGAPAKVIYTCTVPGTIAITFDDGPAATTPELLDVLERYPDVRVTFFVNGLNYVDASQPHFQAIISRAHRNGHQIASHTYQHKDLATLSDSQIEEQMIKNDDVIYSAIGRVPRYMRPPYGSTNAQALVTLGRLGYVVTNWDVDTLDWKGEGVQADAQAYDDAFRSSQANTFIALQHDTIESTANDLMGLVIPMVRKRGLRMVTIAECLGDNRPYL